jgi:hypothetical protein
MLGVCSPYGIAEISRWQGTAASNPRPTLSINLYSPIVAEHLVLTLHSDASVRQCILPTRTGNLSSADSALWEPREVWTLRAPRTRAPVQWPLVRISGIYPTPSVFVQRRLRLRPRRAHPNHRRGWRNVSLGRCWRWCCRRRWNHHVSRPNIASISPGRYATPSRALCSLLSVPL